MNQRLKEKVDESLRSALPITIIVLLLSVTIAPMPSGTLMLFLFGAVMLIVGIGIFSLGADISMLPMGESVGARMSKIKRTGLAAALCFVMGAVITVAEPDLQVLAHQVPSITDAALIFTVAGGVGLFLVISLLRMHYKIPLHLMLLGFYILLFVLAPFAPRDMLAVAFDSGGVTTGPVTVPFIMALGIGMASLRSDKTSREDSFGLIALCSVGPVLAVLLLSILFKPSTADYSFGAIPDVLTTADMASQFAKGIPTYIAEVAVAVLPIALLFAVYQLLTRRFHKKQLTRVIIGFLYTYAGLVLFLTGVNVGFLPVGHYLGTLLGGGKYPWLLIPIGMLMGYFLVEAEPAVHVLKREVEGFSNGAISQRALQKSLSIGVAAAVGASMLRVLTGISLFYFLVPGYAAALTLSFFVPHVFTAIAFDAGGVATGPMTAAFLLPLAIGATEAAGGNILTDSFGLVALVAMAPLITIQLLGLRANVNKPRTCADLPPRQLMQLAEAMVYYGEVDLDA